MTNNMSKSRILAEVHETATGLHQAGVISKRCMHEYELLSHLAVPRLEQDDILPREPGARGVRDGQVVSNRRRKQPT